MLSLQAKTILCTIRACALLALTTLGGSTCLNGEEPRIIGLKGLEIAEVRHGGFSLAQAAKVHVYAKGGGLGHFAQAFREEPFFAQGWILNANTREVVWQMDRSSAKREGEYWVCDRYLDLPAGPYEAYFANHGFGQSLLFAQWTRNIDRRRPASRDSEDSHLLRQWRDQVGSYGLEITLASGSPSTVSPFEAPLRWKNIVISLPARNDEGQWKQAFHLDKAVALHVYAMGEGSGRQMYDYGWITNARTRVRVWEMSMDKSQFAGGAPKNRRQVETINLPAGDYEATFITDDSNSPADWNAIPPCDPEHYGLTLSLPAEKDVAAFTLTNPLKPVVLAELVRIGNDQDRVAPFTLNEAQSLQVYAIAEGNGNSMADEAWIEDSTGNRVWAMKPHRSRHAGGASKNLMADELISLPKGAYLLRFRTDDSHAFGDWNSRPPQDQGHYGVTIYTLK